MMPIMIIDFYFQSGINLEKVAVETDNKFNLIKDKIPSSVYFMLLAKCLNVEINLSGKKLKWLVLLVH